MLPAPEQRISSEPVVYEVPRLVTVLFKILRTSLEELRDSKRRSETDPPPDGQYHLILRLRTYVR